MNTLKEINFHITDVCNGHCPMCYATEEGMCRSNGDSYKSNIPVKGHDCLATQNIEGDER